MLMSLSDVYEFACGIWSFSDEAGQAFEYAALSQV